MQKSLSIIILLTQLLASLLVLGSVFIWAPVCDGLLTLASGTLVHMKCFYTAQASIALALILMITAIAAYFSKTDHNKIQWVVIIIGIMLISNTFESTIGIGVCKKSTMACISTAVWLRASGFLAVASGLLDIFVNRNKKKEILQ